MEIREGEQESDSLDLPYPFARDNHVYIREFIRLADEKAAFVFGASAAMLAYMLARSKPQDWIRWPNSWDSSEFALIPVMLLVISCSASIWVVIPRLGGPRAGLIFWEAVANFGSAERYAADVLKLRPRELTEAVLEHYYELAKVCRRKYLCLAWAFWVMLVAFIASFVCIALQPK